MIALVDTIVSSRPWNIWYVLYPTSLGIAYLIFNVIYILVFNGTNSKGEEYVYDILDWKNNPGLAVGLMFGVVIGFPLAFCLYYLLAMIRDYLWKKICMQDIDIGHTNLVQSNNSKASFEEQP